MLEICLINKDNQNYNPQRKVIDIAKSFSYF